VEGVTQSFTVTSHRGAYLVRRAPVADAFSSGLLPADRLVVDRTVLALHPSVTDLAPAEQTLTVEAGESLKSLEGVASVLSWLLESGFSRTGTLHVVGGGTVQDAACFVASILHRGVRWAFVPTTLLAQGDSCIGSKSSINHDNYKNQLGTFYPPAEVVIDDSFLETLPARDVRSGIGEMLHYAVLGGEEAFAPFEVALANGWEQPSSTEMIALAWPTLLVKRRFVESDEFDTDLRRNLNLGHTFGHGLEFASDGRIPHGIAVAYGIDLANAYAVEAGLLKAETRVRVGRVVRTLVDREELALVTATGLLEGMAKDKKRCGHDIELVLIEDLGRPIRLKVPLDDRLGAFLQRYLASWSQTGDGKEG
jgi:3-dehydroquinate synthase